MPKSQSQSAKRQARKIFAALNSRKEGLELTGSIDLDISAAEDGKEKLAEFSMVAYTGAAMQPGGWHAEHPVILDISGMETPPRGRMPIHRDHDRGKVVGHSTSVRKGGTVTVKGTISAVNVHAKEIVDSSRNDFPWQSSVGAQLLAAPSFVAEGDTVRVNGRVHKGPVYVARKSRLFEASFVSIGADSNTSAVAAGEEEYTMNPEFKKWLQAKGFDPETMDEGQITAMEDLFGTVEAAKAKEDKAPAKGNLQAAGDAPLQQPQVAAQSQSPAITAESSEDPLAERRVMIEAEMRRESLVRKRLGDFPELQAKAILEGWGEDRIELEAYRQNGAATPAIHVEAQIRDNPEAIECSLYMGHHIGTRDQAVKEYGEKVVNVAAAKCPQGAGLKYLIHEYLRANGNSEHISSFGDSTIKAALQLDQRRQFGMVQAHQGFSTIGLSSTLSNLANKSLLRGFNAVPSVFRTFCKTIGHSDFKTHTKHRVTTMGRLLELPPAGEIKHTELSEEEYSNIVKTYARMIVLTRTMMRNDDLDAFLQLPSGLGRISAETLEHSVFELLTNNASGFHSDIAVAIPGQAGKTYSPNALAAGAGSALSTTSLNDAENLFWDQTDSDGKPISLRPSLLLVGHKLKRDAENIINKTTVTVAGDPASTTQMRVSNEFQGDFNVATSPYINNGTGGASDTQWWLMAAPAADVAAYEVAFLDNRQTPIIESAETDFNTLGMQWRSYFDWGVAELERRALVYSPGA